MDTVQKTAAGSQQRILEFDLASELHHGMLVSNLAYAVAEEMGLPHEQCYELAIAGMLHDIGKLKLTSYINGQEQDPLVIEELKYVRMHSTLGYEELKGQGYSDLYWRVSCTIMRIMMAAVTLPIKLGRKFL